MSVKGLNVATLMQLPFVQVALPLLVGIFLAVQVNNKRLDDLRGDFNRRFDEVIKRLDRIELKLEDHGNRIINLDAETSPLAKR